MNTYAKYCPNVFVAKCTEPHEKGETIPVTTRYSKVNDCIVFNLLLVKDGFYYYSIVRSDGFNSQEWAKRRAERHLKSSTIAEKKSNQYYEKSNQHSEFLKLGEPIKIGHHSENRHRRIIEQANNNIRKSVEFIDKSKEYKDRADYWQSRANDINLSMPESLEYFEYKLEEAKMKHQGLKSGKIERLHSFSLTYAKKEVNEMQKKLDIAKKLWG